MVKTAENGGGAEGGPQGRKTKIEESEQKSSMTLGGKVADVGFGAEGIQNWFGLGNSDVFGWFDDVGGANVGQGLQLWPGTGTGSGNGEQNFGGGGGEGFRTEFGGGCRASGVMGIESSAFQLWHGGNGDVELQMGRAGQNACENTAVGLVGEGTHALLRGEIRAGNVGLGSGVDGLHVSFNENGGGIGGKSVRGDEHEAPFGKVKRICCDLNLGCKGIESLLGECKNNGAVPTGIQCWCGEAGCASLDGNGIQGLFGEIAYGTVGEGTETGHHENDGQPGLTDEQRGVKRRLGRPKGSKNKKKKKTEGVGEHSVEGGETVPSKPKQGRPKGSKNKTRNPEGEANQAVHCNASGEMASVGTDTGWYYGNGGQLAVKDEVKEVKRRLGRPKGSKKKNKIEGTDGLGAAKRDGGETIPVKPKRGRPKGLKNKKSNRNNAGGDEDVPPSQEEKEMPGISGGWGVGLVTGTSPASTIDGIITIKGRRGRPKGSKKKKVPTATLR